MSSDVRIFDESEDIELVLSDLTSVLKYMRSKALYGRLCDEDKLRLQWLKALINGCKVYSLIKKELYVESLAKNLDLLRCDVIKLKETEFKESKRSDLIEAFESLEEKIIKLKEEDES